MYTNILLAIDGSPTSDRALQEALRLAADQGARLRLVHVVENAQVWNIEAFVDTSTLQQALRQAGELILARARSACNAAGIEVECVLHESLGERVAKSIVDEARNWPADLVVIGTHGRGGIDHLLFGSVAEHVIRATPVPLLLVRSQIS